MFVRTVYATGDPARLESALRALNSRGHDLLEERPGYRGAGVFVDRELGKLFTVSWWESEEAQVDSDEVMRERRPALLEPFAASVAVEHYRVAVFHALPRPVAGGGLRVARLEFDPRDADLLADTFHATVLPRLETVPGLARTALLLDRDRGRGIVGTVFSDGHALASSRAPVSAVRRSGTAKARATVVALEEFEVVHADAQTL
ncbi:hypothetical protein GTY81_16690 [Streptomyces sp. SID8366]|uniref:hypothetical protein n=1 Tax=unclassified Streptomyces TaxID=2593676 RepID=UPI000DBA673F|nr:hypothetical protein [Streptomyces sp. PsTaAH-130]MYU05502.1 hypothetical protein [Streptomyces sp. SID8366]MYU63588.1 hypothetical protein [Streptomyces sp. SID69]RAJ66388.1 hypothetical protein K376_00655 [Streptomyces sp. PsTaAH-130]